MTRPVPHPTGKPSGPKLQPVDSKMIKAIGWEPSGPKAEHGTLHVQFSDGTVWEFPKYSASEWKRFQLAPSKGAFFHSHIKPHHIGKRKGT